jgi:hypothetical protein
MRITSEHRWISEKLEIEGIETLPGEQGLFWLLLSHRGPEASKNVHGGPQLRMERFSIVFGLDLHRQMGVTKYIDRDNGNLDPHPIFENAYEGDSETPELT